MSFPLGFHLISSGFNESILLHFFQFHRLFCPQIHRFGQSLLQIGILGIKRCVRSAFGSSQLGLQIGNRSFQLFYFLFRFSNQFFLLFNGFVKFFPGLIRKFVLGRHIFVRRSLRCFVCRDFQLLSSCKFCIFFRSRNS